MNRVAATVFASALCLAALAPARARALPPENTTRLAVQAGWRYQPNVRFNEWTAHNGFVQTGPSPGGPTFVLTFGYRPLQELEVSIDLGYAFEQFSFASEKPMQLHQLPVNLALRWTPFTAFGGSFFPHVGVGYGYVLNFFQDAPSKAVESHGNAPILMVGATLELTKTVSLTAEYRYSYCRVEIANLGYLQAGGNSFLLGVQVGFPPEDNRLQ